MFALAAPMRRAADASKYDDPSRGPPVSLFSANPSLQNQSSSLIAAAKATSDILDSYPLDPQQAPSSNIYCDWSGFDNGAAYVWTANMKVDCDGLDYRCKGNPDGQSQTDFGALSAYEVPYIVIPGRFVSARPKELPGNNIAAVICNGQILYGVFGDTNGDDPQVIGEASWRMATACFPKDGLNGDAGHDKPDVTYIVFTGKDAVLPDAAIGQNYITNFKTLTSTGDSLLGQLIQQLGN